VANGGTDQTGPTWFDAINVKSYESGEILLETQTASSDATIDFTKGVTAAFSSYKIEFISVIPATDDQEFRGRVTVGGTIKSGASDYTAAAGALDHIPLTSGSPGVDASNVASEGGVSGEVMIYAPANSANYTHVRSETVEFNADNTVATSRPAGVYVTAEAVDGFSFHFASGNIASGTFKLYGII